MSHELRTPLNSLLILARELEDNPEQNLTEAQVQYASVIHSSGTDLLRLLNDILDLAKVESGTVALEISELPLAELQDALERDFGPVADQKGVAFSVELAPGLPPTIATDSGRLRQVLKNLLSNAFKFTEQGEVERARRAAPDERLEPGERDALARRGAVIAFTITRHRHRHPARDCSSASSRRSPRPTARRPASTAAPGWGCRSAASWCGCSAARSRSSSTPGEGSTFTVYLPAASPAPVGRRRRAAVAGARHRGAGDRRARADALARGAGLAGMKVAGGRRRLPQHLRPHGAARARRRSR